MSCGAIIVAAGEGSRMESKIPKPYIKLKGVPIITLTLKCFDEIDEIANIIVVTHPEWVDYCKGEIIEKSGFKKVSAVIKGGKRRQDSVRLGLEVGAIHELPLLIHDAVRPFVTRDFIIHLIEMGKKYGAVVPGIPVTDTIKEINEDKNVYRTLQREWLYKIQTPQVFELNVIKKAYQEAYADGFYGTDDSALVERIGVPVKVVEGLRSNIKITTQEDLLYAEQLLNT